MDNMCEGLFITKHFWSKWEIKERGDVSSNDKKIGWVIRQERVCSRCGKTELSVQKRTI